mmetsp:Transcript_19699/g.27058  ORF Transcript_19699/g.27058 Transcript_19699/m.27058 type:complete len:139 (-) Transcript_19699:292-708(-)
MFEQDGDYENETFSWNKRKSKSTYRARSICFKCIEHLWKSDFERGIRPDEEHSTENEQRFIAEFTFDSSSNIFVAFTMRDKKFRIKRNKLHRDRSWEEKKIKKFCSSFCKEDSGEKEERHESRISGSDQQEGAALDDG